MAKVERHLCQQAEERNPGRMALGIPQASRNPRRLALQLRLLLALLLVQMQRTQLCQYADGEAREWDV